MFQTTAMTNHNPETEQQDHTKLHHPAFAIAYFNEAMIGVPQRIPVYGVILSEKKKKIPLKVHNSINWN